MAKSQELCNFDKRETAMLGLLDEADAPHRIAIIEPVARIALTGREQAFPLVITQRIGADMREGRNPADGEHGACKIYKGALGPPPVERVRQFPCLHNNPQACRR